MINYVFSLADIESSAWVDAAGFAGRQEDVLSLSVLFVWNWLGWLSDFDVTPCEASLVQF